MTLLLRHANSYERRAVPLADDGRLAFDVLMTYKLMTVLSAMEDDVEEVLDKYNNDTNGKKRFKDYRNDKGKLEHLAIC